MTSMHRSRAAALAITLSLVAMAGEASAQSYDAPSPNAEYSDALAIGDWLFRPSIEVRTQGELRRNPFDAGGQSTTSGATTFTTPSSQVSSQWWVLSRSRVGLTADQGPFRVVVQVQDARAWGSLPPAQADRRDSLPNTSVHLGYAELHGKGERASFLRLGRQEIRWGDGRLVGESDWSPTGRAFDAIRGVAVAGAWDFDAFASVLASPGALPPELRRGGTGGAEGTGSQLYGLRAAWRLSPKLKVEWNNLGRVVREPSIGGAPPSDLVLSGVRLSGEIKRFSYAAEGAYELGRKATIGAVENLRAFAGTARAEFTTGLPGRIGIGAQGSYASGRKDTPVKADGSNDTRFDPMLPDARGPHGPMGLYAWSNVMEAAGLLRFTPIAESRVTLGYRYVALAEPSDTWATASSISVGRDAANTSRTLGHEVDAGAEYSPWAPLKIAFGYGAFLTGSGAKNILEASGRGRPNLQHYGYLQLTLRAP